jgi:hypothetical protein
MAGLNVLVVADGIFSFGPQATALPVPGEPDERDVNFTITKFLTILRQSVKPELAITTAHRAGDPNAALTAPFNFAHSVPDLSAFDVIWLFGHAGTNFNSETGEGAPQERLEFIDPDEILVMAEYMNGGGGVFATGDHEGLGSLMCGMLPRVRSMRAWFSVVDTDPRIPPAAPRNWPGTGAGRADTLQLSENGQWYFDNQSDDIPQKLSFPNGRTHPILQGAEGPIAQFPDHMHEGQVILPWTLSDQLMPGWAFRELLGGRVDPEYPTFEGHQEHPVILATGQTIPNHAAPTTDNNGPVANCDQVNFYDDTVPTQAESLTVNVLAAYDGHAVGVGRVVVDSSFHHYIDLNLIGDPCSPPGAKNQGFTTPRGAPVLADMSAFFVNTVAWLARAPGLRMAPGGGPPGPM